MVIIKISQAVQMLDEEIQQQAACELQQLAECLEEDSCFELQHGEMKAVRVGVNKFILKLSSEN